MILSSELEALTQRRARVGEVAAAVDGGGDGDDVVVVLGAEHPGRPLENVLVVEGRELAAQACLVGARDDLLRAAGRQ